MKQLLLLAAILIIWGCEKKEPPQPAGAYQMRVIDVTPETYAFVQGRWQWVNPSGNGNKLHFKEDTLFWTTIYTMNTDTFIYRLYRQINMNIISVTSIYDAAQTDTIPFEITESNQFRVNGESYTRQ